MAHTCKPRNFRRFYLNVLGRYGGAVLAARQASGVAGLRRYTGGRRSRSGFTTTRTPGGFYAILSSPSFPPVPAGDIIPQAEKGYAAQEFLAWPADAESVGYDAARDEIIVRIPRCKLAGPMPYVITGAAAGETPLCAGGGPA